MSLSLDLLEQAKHLAKKEPKRPKQASLRRAVSTAYYALFHFLIDKACSLIVSGTGADREAQRRSVARGFIHGNMKSVSEAFSKTNSPNPWKNLSGTPIPKDLEKIAATFVELQQARHEADYDLTKDFKKEEVLGLITLTENAFKIYRQVKDNVHTRSYLLGLLIERDRG